MSEAFFMESSLDMLRTDGDKSESGFGSCMLPVPQAASFLPNMSELPAQIRDFSSLQVCYRSNMYWIELGKNLMLLKPKVS